MRKRGLVIDLRRAPEHRPPCWIVWSVQTTGLTQLRAIDRKVCFDAYADTNSYLVQKADLEWLRGKNPIFVHAADPQVLFEYAKREGLIGSEDQLWLSGEEYPPANKRGVTHGKIKTHGTATSNATS